MYRELFRNSHSYYNFLKEKEDELSQRIVRLSEIGISLISLNVKKKKANKKSKTSKNAPNKTVKATSKEDSSSELSFSDGTSAASNDSDDELCLICAEIEKNEVEHFSFVDKRTFSLRYLVNDSFWDPEHGPIFFYPGNEADIEIFAQNTGFIWEAAVKFHALVVFGEHRFYGKSMPFGNLSFTDPKYYGYLTSQQALADFVDLIYYLRNQKPTRGRKMKKLNPVISIGGSYGGMLAAWMRMKYPAVIEGALASSAPIWYFPSMVSCDSFYRVLTSVYQLTSKTCSENIRKSWNEINRIAMSKTGKLWISKTWKLCTPLKDPSDVDLLSWWLMDMFSAVGMVNYPYSTNFLVPLPAHPVKEICNHLQVSLMKGKPLLRAIFNAASIYFNYTGSATCLPWENSTWGDIEINGWNIQTCMEMVMPFCANGKTDIFKSHRWSFSEWDSWCYRNYKLHPVENIIEKLYGGKNIDAISNIIFSNGLLDPWSSGGVLHSKLNSIVSVVIPNAAHHLDLRPTNAKDPLSIKKARRKYFKIFRKWIKHYYKK